MSEKIWHQEYPEDVPHEIDASKYNSLKDLIETSFAKYKDLPAYTCMGKTLTFGEIDERSRYFAA